MTCQFTSLPEDLQANLIENGLAPWEAGLEPEQVKLPDPSLVEFQTLLSKHQGTERVIARLNRYIKTH